MAYFKYVSRDDVPSRQFLNFLEELVDELEIEGYPFNDSEGEEKEDSVWSVEDVTMEEEDVKELILKRGIDPNKTREVVYFKLTNTAVTNPSKYATITVQMLHTQDEGTGEYRYEGPIVKYQMADESMSNTERTKDHAFRTFLNIDNDRIAVIAQADPVVNFDDTRISFMYIGDIELFEYNKNDSKGNVLLTAGCVDEEASLESLKPLNQYYGLYTSLGSNTFQMLGTKSGVRFQSHYPAFITTAPKPGDAYVDPVLGDTGLRLEKQGFQASKHTDRYHISPVYVTHPYEGYRGWLKDCLAVINHNIRHTDKLIVDVDECQYPEKAWKQEVYRLFAIDTDQNFFNRSPNRGAVIAILTELRY